MRRRQAGFTLVEMLASLAVAAIVLPIAMQGVSLALRLSAQAKHEVEAGNLARAKMSELTATGTWQTAELSGDFGTDWPAYRWTGLLTEYDGTKLQQLDVTVTWTARGRDRAVTLTTLVYNSGQ